MAGCAACAAAGVSGCAAWKSAPPAASVARKVRVRLVFSHPLPGITSWPGAGVDFAKRIREIEKRLPRLCPALDLQMAAATNAKEAKAILTGDKETEAYVVWFMGMGGGGPVIEQHAGKTGRPMVRVGDPYCGPQPLGYNGRVAKQGGKAICVSPTRLEDAAAIINCLEALGRPGGTADEFLAAARERLHASFAGTGDGAAAADDSVTTLPVKDCLERLKSSTILLVGRPVTPLARTIQEQFGVRIESVGFPEIHAAWEQADPEASAALADRWMRSAKKVVEPKREDILKSAAMSLAMESVMAKRKADAITINCLGGFYGGHLKAYPCLGFVALNDAGRIGACEGDLASTFTMLAVGALSGRPGYISDPVIDTSTRRIVYAHCVAPTKVFGPEGHSNPYLIRSHAEDARGASVQSLMPVGYMTTTLKFVPQQRAVVLHRAKAVGNVDDERACRTKLAAEVKGDLEKLFTNWGNGWHRVTFYGDLKEPIRELCEAAKFTLVEEA